MFEYLYNKNLVKHGSEIKTPPNNLNENKWFKSEGKYGY